MNRHPVLLELEELLVSLAPGAVAAIRDEIVEPVYSLRIWYHGTDSYGDLSPSLMLPRESIRRERLLTKGRQAPHHIWCADELTGIGTAYWADLNNARVSELCSIWFGQLTVALEEREGLLPVREAVQLACQRLNAIDWRRYASITDDFIVFPADASHTFCNDYDEMIASVPAEKIERLRSQKMLGTQIWYEL